MATIPTIKPKLGINYLPQSPRRNLHTNNNSDNCGVLSGFDKEMDMDKSNWDFSSCKTILCNFSYVDTCIIDYETETNLEHEVCQRLSGEIPKDFPQRVPSNFRRKRRRSCTIYRPNQQSLPDVVLSCSDERKSSSQKLKPEVCGRVLSHIADHFEMDRRKKTTHQNLAELPRNIPNQNEKRLCEHPACEIFQDIKKDGESTNRQTHNFQDEEIGNISEGKPTFAIHTILKNLLQRIIEEILFNK
ncbi:hypothetical protein JTE90_026829 [Oedothorax gibbosus]|uniref:Uncharacterized protein n=1 Tax=Oedothorax gibbosus TaxID=931172 RepID=A0AAV6V5P8_9ARAC|nr:hypothetical protein JTE90_026829 [Oedothorax gibbosus]